MDTGLEDGVVEADTFAKALGRLSIHGGVEIRQYGPEEGMGLTGGHKGWRKPYQEQSVHRVAQLAPMTRFPESHDFSNCSNSSNNKGHP